MKLDRRLRQRQDQEMESMQRQTIDNSSVITRNTVARDASNVLISLCLCIVSTVFVLFAENSAAQQSDRPNFLVIVADDMGYSDLGSYGG